MNCPDDGILRAKLDGELSPAQLEDVSRHLASCADCRRREQALAESATRALAALEALSPPPAEAPADVRLALAQLKEHLSEPASLRSRVMQRIAQGGAPAWAAEAVIVGVVVLLSFAPARSWAQRILAMLRVQKVSVVAFDPVSVPSPANREHATKMLSQLISNDVVVTLHGKPQPAANRDEASRLAGFHVRVVTDRDDPPRIEVTSEQAFHMTLNRDRLQALIAAAGRSVQLPASIDGAEVAVQIPRMATLRYGNCPGPRRGKAGEERPGFDPSQPSNCLFVIEAPSPTISVPPSLNLAQIAEAGLEVAGMKAEDAHSFAQSVDWTSTLVIPIPLAGAEYQRQEVDGVQGTLIRRNFRNGRQGAGYMLIWVKNGVIYSLAGSGNFNDAVALADSLG